MATGTIKSSVRDYTFGTYVTLTQNVNYTCPSDGLLSIACPAAANSYCNGYVNNTAFLVLSTTATVGTIAGQYASLFVRKGMKVKFIGTTGATGYFFPIVEQ